MLSIVWLVLQQFCPVLAEALHTGSKNISASAGFIYYPLFLCSMPAYMKLLLFPFQFSARCISTDSLGERLPPGTNASICSQLRWPLLPLSQFIFLIISSFIRNLILLTKIFATKLLFHWWHSCPVLMFSFQGPDFTPQPFFLCSLLQLRTPPGLWFTTPAFRALYFSVSIIP